MGKRSDRATGGGDEQYSAEDRARGARIREAYLRAGMKRSEFARRLGGGYYHNVLRLEKGQKPKPETLQQIAEICGVTEQWIVRGPDYSQEFSQWLAERAPDDLHDLERELLGAIQFPTQLHPGPGWYSMALEAWRMGTDGALAEQTQVRKAKPPGQSSAK